MSATDELRRLLDERVVEWWPLGSDMTECVVDDVRIKYRQVGRGLIVSTCTEGTVTPEQAVAATLGPGTCHDMGGCRWFRCSACGFGIEDMYLNDEDEYPPKDQPKHCPNCGARVVE